MSSVTFPRRRCSGLKPQQLIIIIIILSTVHPSSHFRISLATATTMQNINRTPRRYRYSFVVSKQQTKYRKTPTRLIVHRKNHVNHTPYKGICYSSVCTSMYGHPVNVNICYLVSMERTWALGMFLILVQVKILTPIREMLPLA